MFHKIVSSAKISLYTNPTVLGPDENDPQKMLKCQKGKTMFYRIKTDPVLCCSSEFGYFTFGTDQYFPPLNSWKFPPYKCNFSTVWLGFAREPKLV